MFHVYLKLLLYRLEMSHFLRNPGSFYWGVVIRKKKSECQICLFLPGSHCFQPLSVDRANQEISFKKREEGKKKREGERHYQQTFKLISSSFLLCFIVGKTYLKSFFLLQTKVTTYILLFLASLSLLILYWKSLHSMCNDLPQSFQVDNLFYQSSRGGLLCCSLIFLLQNCHIEKRRTYVVSYRWRSIFRVNSQNWHCWVGGKGIVRYSQIPFHRDW